MQHDEQERHRCEVRLVCSLSSSQARADYLAEVAKRRGTESAELLRAEARKQYGLGNRGAYGEWFE